MYYVEICLTFACYRFETSKSDSWSRQEVVMADMCTKITVQLWDEEVQMIKYVSIGDAITITNLIISRFNSTVSFNSADETSVTVSRLSSSSTIENTAFSLAVHYW